MNDRRPSRAVVDGKPAYTSVSALNRFSDCERSWWFRYVKGLPDPVGKAAEIGIKGHERLEYYLRTGEDILHSMERAGLRYIPEPGTDLLVEQRVDGGLDLGGIPLIGNIDLVNPRLPGRLVLTDWKFKGDLAFGATKPEWLTSVEHSDGRQMIGYAEYARRNLAERYGAKTLVVRHVHFQTRGAHTADEVSAEISLAEVAEKWDSCSRLSSRLFQVAAAEKPQDVTPNFSHCRKYRRPCVYMRECPQGRVAALPKYFKGRPSADKREDNSMSMLSKLNKLNGTPAPSFIIDESTIPDEVLKKQRAVTDSTVLVAQAVVESAKRMGTTPAPSAVEMLEKLDTTAEGFAPAVKPPAVPEAVVSSAPKRRGRPAKSQDASQNAAQNTNVKSAPEQAKWAEATQDVSQIASQDGFRLYFDCSPVGAPTQTLHSYMVDLEKKILEQFEDPTAPSVLHSKHRDLDFGRWKVVLSAAAAENPPPFGYYVVTGGDERIGAVAAGLESLASKWPGAVTR